MLQDSIDKESDLFIKEIDLDKLGNKTLDPEHVKMLIERIDTKLDD